jgi:hypothetical protein
LRVIDGARDRWYPLLLLDAALGLLWSNDFSFNSKKAFNQRKVLYDCIVRVLRRTELYPLQPMFSPSFLASIDWHSSLSTPSTFFISDDGQLKKCSGMPLKDDVAFQRAEDAHRLFPNILTMFPPDESVCEMRSLHNGFEDSSAAGYRYSPGYVGQHHGSRTSYCFPSPFAKPISSLAIPFHNALSSDIRRTSAVDTATPPSSESIQQMVDMSLQSSPWTTSEGFRSLALSDPPAKSRSRFENAVIYLTEISRVCEDGKRRELGELLHLVVCKVLLHEYCTMATDDCDQGLTNFPPNQLKENSKDIQSTQSYINRNSDYFIVMEETLLDDFHHIQSNDTVREKGKTTRVDNFPYSNATHRFPVTLSGYKRPRENTIDNLLSREELQLRSCDSNQCTTKRETDSCASFRHGKRRGTNNSTILSNNVSEFAYLFENDENPQFHSLRALHECDLVGDDENAFMLFQLMSSPIMENDESDETDR